MPLAHSVPEVAQALGIGRTKAWELVNDGTIPTFRVGRRVLVAEEDLRTIPDRLRAGTHRPAVDALVELIDEDGRIDIDRIPPGSTLADLEAAKRIIASRSSAA